MIGGKLGIGFKQQYLYDFFSPQTNLIEIFCFGIKFYIFLSNQVIFGINEQFNTNGNLAVTKLHNRLFFLGVIFNGDLANNFEFSQNAT